MNDNFLLKKLQERTQANALRSLTVHDNITDGGKVDFCSNDYLGIVKNKLIEKSISQKLSYGSTGSRLIAGNYELIEATEEMIAGFHDADAGLIFNSGYDANVGLLSSVPQKNDAIIYDQLSHASLRDGIRLSFAAAFPFLHNNLEDLEKKLASAKATSRQLFVVTESVFSMDGDFAPLKEIVGLCEKYAAALIVDEAHATGVVGEKGEGLVQQLKLQKKCFARINTFGKACGAHGAIIVGSQKLKEYLINFARTFIYTTSLPPSAIEAVRISYNTFPAMEREREHLRALIEMFKNADLRYQTLPGDTPIQIVVIPGNEEVKKMAKTLQDNNFDVRPILYPTVPQGQERLRIVLHAFNRAQEVKELLAVLRDR